MKNWILLGFAHVINFNVVTIEMEIKREGDANNMKPGQEFKEQGGSYGHTSVPIRFRQDGW